jgi:hypothetical protein
MNFTFQQKLTMAMGFVGAATSAFGALNPIMTSTSALIGTVVFGFVSACLAVVATVTSSQTSQIGTVQAIATGPSSPTAVSAQNALVGAVSAIAQDKTIPKSEEAKDALVAATIALPQVHTILTDKATAEASPSPNVKAA